jgi:hypothetical protein
MKFKPKVPARRVVKAYVYSWIALMIREPDVKPVW